MASEKVAKAPKGAGATVGGVLDKDDLFQTLQEQIDFLSMKSKSLDGITRDDLKPLIKAVSDLRGVGLGSDATVKRAVDFQMRISQQLVVQQDVKNALATKNYHEMRAAVMKARDILLQTRQAKQLEGEVLALNKELLKKAGEENERLRKHMQQTGDEPNDSSNPRTEGNINGDGGKSNQSSSSASPQDTANVTDIKSKRFFWRRGDKTTKSLGENATPDDYQLDDDNKSDQDKRKNTSFTNRLSFRKVTLPPVTSKTSGKGGPDASPSSPSSSKKAHDLQLDYLWLTNPEIAAQADALKNELSEFQRQSQFDKLVEAMQRVKILMDSSQEKRGPSPILAAAGPDLDLVTGDPNTVHMWLGEWHGVVRASIPINNISSKTILVGEIDSKVMPGRWQIRMAKDSVIENASFSTPALYQDKDIASSSKADIGSQEFKAKEQQYLTEIESLRETLDQVESELKQAKDSPHYTDHSDTKSAQMAGEFSSARDLLPRNAPVLVRRILDIMQVATLSRQMHTKVLKYAWFRILESDLDLALDTIRRLKQTHNNIEMPVGLEDDFREAEKARIQFDTAVRSLGTAPFHRRKDLLSMEKAVRRREDARLTLLKTREAICTILETAKPPLLDIAVLMPIEDALREQHAWNSPETSSLSTVLQILLVGIVIAFLFVFVSSLLLGQKLVALPGMVLIATGMAMTRWRVKKYTIALYHPSTAGEGVVVAIEDSVNTLWEQLCSFVNSTASYKQTSKVNASIIALEDLVDVALADFAKRDLVTQARQLIESPWSESAAEKQNSSLRLRAAQLFRDHQKLAYQSEVLALARTAVSEVEGLHNSIARLSKEIALISLKLDNVIFDQSHTLSQDKKTRCAELVKARFRIHELSESIHAYSGRFDPVNGSLICWFPELYHAALWVEDQSGLEAAPSPSRSMPLQTRDVLEGLLRDDLRIGCDFDKDYADVDQNILNVFRGRGGTVVCKRMITTEEVKVLKRVQLSAHADDVVMELRKLRQVLCNSRRVEHQNILPCEGVVMRFGNNTPLETVYLQFAFQEGGDLEYWLNAKTRPVARRFQVVTDLARALAAMHAENLYHRDIKPRNVVMSSMRDDARPFFTDFEHSKLLTGDGIATHRTQSPVGTIGFMAPEIRFEIPVQMCANTTEASLMWERCDVYSFGATSAWVLYPNASRANIDKDALRKGLASFLQHPVNIIDMLEKMTGVVPTDRPRAKEFNRVLSKRKCVLRIDCTGTCEDRGVLCPKGEHFVCVADFRAYIEGECQTDLSERIKSKGNFCCPEKKDCSLTDYFSAETLGRNLPNETLEMVKKSLGEIVEADQAKKMRAELDVFKRKHAQESIAVIQRTYILDTIMTDRCPACSTAWIYESGCGALKCTICPKTFCAFCLTASDSSEECHLHVRRCGMNPRPNSYDLNPALFAQVRRGQRAQALRSYLASLPTTVLTNVVADAVIRGIMNELGL